jgi:adenylate cyclase
VISQHTNTVYEFGPFRLEPHEHRLVCEGRPVPLPGKAFQTLCFLLERHGKLVSKPDLMQAVWPETTVEENNLDRNISMLRKALGEQPNGQSYIETVPRAGYRFIAAVTESVSVNPSQSDQLSPVRNVEDPTSSAHDIYSIAVLPFADMSPGRDQDYLCEGLAEELINALTRIEGLRVVSRTASFQFRDPGADIRAIGNQLNVGTLLEGSVRKADDRLRVTVQLIEVASGYHRWSQRFDRQLDDVFAIQDEIAESVATSLRGTMLSQREKQALVRPHTGTDAYEYYLRGLQCLPRLTTPDLATSARMFERAIELDPNYSPAFAGLAMVHATLHEWFGAKADDLAAAERASRRALELTPDLAEAHVARGCALALSRRYDEAAKEFEDAIRLNPNLFDAYYYFGRASFAVGNIERSAELFGKAAATRHEDFQSPLLQGQALRMLGHKEQALEPQREGIHRAERALKLNPYNIRALSLGAGTLFHTGEPERALEWARRAIQLNPDDMGSLVNAACLYAKLKQKEEAINLLERVFARGWGKRDWVEHDPDYDILRDDPRFQRMLEKLK